MRCGGGEVSKERVLLVDVDVDFERRMGQVKSVRTVVTAYVYIIANPLPHSSPPPLPLHHLSPKIT